MEETPLAERNYREINQNRRRLLRLAYDSYPEYVYCPPEQYRWDDPLARANVFDLYYLHDRGCVEVMNGVADGRRRPDFFILTPRGADLVEIPGNLDKTLPVED